MRTFVLAALLIGSEIAHGRQPVFKTAVELVRIPISVTQGSVPVATGVLTAQDFVVTEDGRRQQVSLFERESLPLSICIVFDTSGSMSEGPTAQLAVASLRQLLTRLMPEDEVAIVAFAATSELVTPWTPAPRLAASPINLETSGTTALHDGVMKALDVIESAKNPRRVVLLITDGGENSSQTQLERMVRTRRQSETLVYGFHITPEISKLPPSRSIVSGIDGVTPPAPVPPASYFTQLPSGMEDLVGDSGGVVYRVRMKEDSAEMARAVVEDLRFQYTLGYSPQKALDGKYRRVKVEIRKRGFKVRHRGGYLALPSEPRQ